jgi:hypothetical protein
MARPNQIDFRRMTISLPGATIDTLKINKKKGEVSEYINSLIEEDMALIREKQETTEEFIESLKKLAVENSSKCKTKKSTLEMTREIRYHGKY